MGAAKLVEQGIRAYGRGALREAERLWREALELEPGNERARSYLLALVHGLRQETIAGAPPMPQVVPEVTTGWDLEPPRVPPMEVTPDEVDLDLRELEPPPTGPATREEEILAWMQAARDHYALGDFTGSIEAIERILELDPHHAEARDYLRDNEAALVAMYESKLGSLDRAPRVLLRSEEITWLNLDHRAGFLLAQVDGVATWDDLFALSGLPRLETARILAKLVREGVIAV